MDQEPFSIVLPTLNEEKSLASTISELNSILQNESFKIIVVDDASTDKTQQIAKEKGAELFIRKKKLGLASAIFDGLKFAKTDLVFVLDADGQHDPSVMPLMLQTLRSKKADLVVGSRYIGQNSNMNFERKSISFIATFLTKPLTPKLSDPMSGFFGLRISRINMESKWHLTGYKFLAELVAKHPNLKITEYPFAFRLRKSGSSKMSLLHGINHLHLLFLLYTDSMFSKLNRK